ncbi:hypothetical protein AADZ90_014930 [Aestuariibius sp. 2305UL40-4]|uniref:hypothetical protein n=1 Tax=Aestuariibius violaceus TaxID=3234132 RepID=UPI00345E9FB8
MRRFAFALLLVFAAPVAAQEGPEFSVTEPPMTLERMARIAEALDPEARAQGNVIELTIDDIPVLIVTDPLADRMRAMVPIRSADGLSNDELMRLMQANFDSALDARYAVANGRLWSVFIHPLSPLKRDQFISGIGQTINVATTYGSLYTGGAMQFGGGDSQPLQRQLIDRLLEKGEEI